VSAGPALATQRENIRRWLREYLAAVVIPGQRQRADMISERILSEIESRGVDLNRKE
jgi:hypothetical protein